MTEIKKQKAPIFHAVAWLVFVLVFVLVGGVLFWQEHQFAQAAAWNRLDVEDYFWAPNGGFIFMQGEWENGVYLQKKYNFEPALEGVDFKGYGWGPDIGWVAFNYGTGGVHLREPITESILDGSGPWYIDGYAWAPNIGWISFDAIDTGGNSAYQPRVERIEQGNNENAKMEGYAWSPMIGWIDLSHVNIPGWQDNTSPVLNDINCEPTSATTGLFNNGVYFKEGHNANFTTDFCWVNNDVDFYVDLQTRDTNTRAQDLYISQPVFEQQPLPEELDYYWKDRTWFKSSGDPSYSGYLPPEGTFASEFKRDPSFAEGENPQKIPVGITQPNLPSNWRTRTYLHSDNGGVEGQTWFREFRFNAIDAAGNFACKVDSLAYYYYWDGTVPENSTGCIFNTNYAHTNIPRTGIAVDNTNPGGKVMFNGDELNEPFQYITPGEDITFAFEFSDAESGAGRAHWEVTRISPNATYMEDDWYHETITKDFTINFPDLPEGETYELSIKVEDKVGNIFEKTYILDPNPTPPAGAFVAMDPQDGNINRTRYREVNLYVPAGLGENIESVQFSNTSKPTTWYPENELEYDNNNGVTFNAWSLELDADPDESVQGGRHIVYANLCDNTIPTPTCSSDGPVSSWPQARIQAPWWQASYGDIYAGDRVGQMTGVWPYYNPASGYAGYNATFRITADGSIEPNISSEQDWTYGNYGADFAFPGPEASVAPIDWEGLASQSTYVSAQDIWNAEEAVLDFEKDPIIRLFDTSPGYVRLGNKSGKLTIRGRGTLLVDGALGIDSDLYYEDELVGVSTPRLLDSLGVIVRRRGLDMDKNGSVYVDRNVGHIVGTYIVGYDVFIDEYASGIFHTSVDVPDNFSPPSAENIMVSSEQLIVKGLVAARDFDLSRYNTGNPNYLANSYFGGNPCVGDWQCAGFQSSTSEYVYGDASVSATFGEGIKDASLVQNVDFGLGSGQGETSSVTLSAYLRSTIALEGEHVQFSFGNKACVVNPGSGLLLNQDEWRRLQCTVSDVGEVAGSVTVAIKLFGMPNSNVWVDGFQVERSFEASVWHPKYGEAFEDYSKQDTYYGASEVFIYDGRVILNTPPGMAPAARPAWGEGTAN